MVSKDTSIKIIKLNLFPYDIMVSTGASVETVKKRLSSFNINIDEECESHLRSSGLAHTVKLPNRAVLIFFCGIPTPGLVAHEVFHAVWMVLDTMGVDPSVDSEEVYAYMIEYIVNQIIKT